MRVFGVEVDVEVVVVVVVESRLLDNMEPASSITGATPSAAVKTAYGKSTQAFPYL
jgi:hypothetical protein